MNLYLKILLRIILIIVVLLFYNNYRNNQCIINEDCSPIFLSNFFKIQKIFKNPLAIKFTIFNENSSIDVTFDEKYNNINSNSILNQDLLNLINMKNPNYLNDFYKMNKNVNIVDNNKIIIKKLNIANKTIDFLKIKSQISFESTNYDVKIYNCFCKSDIKLKPYENKNLYIYYSVIGKNDEIGSNYSSTKEEDIKFRIIFKRK